jgi:3',5'-nucleoside bisphosphate phosphatase
VIDLHTHSTCSDGTEPPEAIAEMAASAGCAAVALTDHDTLSGLPAARARAVELGVDFVNGCEVSCLFKERSAHVLCYFVEEGEGPLQDELARLRDDRVERNKKLVDKLHDEFGMPITYDEVVAEAAGEESVGRPHFAAVLVRQGAADSTQDAFDKWLGAGKPAYVPKARVAPALIAQLARASGGVAVLAHPYTLRLGDADLQAAVRELAAAGFSGIEAEYGRYSPDERAALRQLAQRAGLVATGGSDYHGTVKPDLFVGVGQGDLRVPDSALEELEARRPG